jgi:hypothetical protein
MSSYLTTELRSLMESRNEEISDKLKKVKAELKKKAELEYLDATKSQGEHLSPHAGNQNALVMRVCRMLCAV